MEREEVGICKHKEVELQSCRHMEEVEMKMEVVGTCRCMKEVVIMVVGIDIHKEEVVMVKVEVTYRCMEEVMGIDTHKKELGMVTEKEMLCRCMVEVVMEIMVVETCMCKEMVEVLTRNKGVEEIF